MDEDKREEVWSDFGDAVNMTPKELEDWLESDDSKRVGQKDDGGESVGHHSGRRIIEIKRKKKTDLSDEDYAHMQKVVGYVHRHCKQGPTKSDMATSDWRYSLMNWGHDPCKS